MLNINSAKIFIAASLTLAVSFFINTASYAQVKWVNVDTAFAPLPSTVQVFKTTDSLDGKPFIAYYLKAKLKDKKLDFTTDTTLGRRLTPLQFYDKNDKPLVVVNCTFFSYETNRSLNVVIKNGKLLGYNIHTIPMKGKDTFQYKHPLGSALGIDKKRNADVAWLFTDSTEKYPYALQMPAYAMKDSIPNLRLYSLLKTGSLQFRTYEKGMPPLLADFMSQDWQLQKWKMVTAIGGGPAIIQNSKVIITNEEELKFTGKAIFDKHPRTCMGYTKDGYLIIMTIQGRFPGIAEGATLEQEAKLLVELGCAEALNLDGGGSSCMLVNGKETITPSEKSVERPVPAVFLIKKN